MDLLCTEGGQLHRAYADPVYLNDDRVIANLLKLEEYYMVPHNFMARQTDVKPYMRKVVAQWMFEVCDEQRCENDVFGLAVHFMDRFLTATPDIKRNRLQLLASACMFISSKLKETCPLSADKLVIYTDYSITLQELLDWEMLVVSKLRWDIGSVTSLDFLDLLIERLRLPVETTRETRRLTLAYIRSTALDCSCSSYPPSMLTAACLLASLQSSTSTWRSALYMQTLHTITGIDREVLLSCQEHIHRVTGSGEQLSPMKTPNTSQPGTPTDTLDVMVN